MALLLCSLALIAFPQDLKPLPEERGLSGKEQVALHHTRMDVPELGALGWTKTTIQRGKIEGATHYLVQRVAEIADLEAPGFRTLETRALYDGELQLVHELRTNQLMGAKAKPIELEWGKDGFRWREGRSGWDTDSSEIRPTAETDIAVLIYGLSIKTPWVAQVFDDETKKVAAQTLQPGEKKDIDGKASTVFKVEGPVPVRHVVRNDGVYLHMEFDAFTATSIRSDDETDRQLGQEIAENQMFEKVLNQRIPAAWTEKNRTYSNPALGMSFKLPKGWTRTRASETDGTALQVLSADQNAYVNMVITGLGTGYTLDSWSEGLEEAYAAIAKNGKVKTKKKTVARLRATSFDYVLAGDTPLDVTAYAWNRNGLGLVLAGGTWQKAKSKLHKETASILKSIKFTKAR